MLEGLMGFDPESTRGKKIDKIKKHSNKKKDVEINLKNNKIGTQTLKVQEI